MVHLAKSVLEIQIDQMRSTHELTERALERYETKLAAWYDEQRMVVDDDENWEDREVLEERLKEFRFELDAYPEVVRASLFTTAYGVFENFLNAICKQSHSQGYVEGVALKDLRGEGIQRARLYLTKVAKISLPGTPEWNDLNDYRLLRNALVHAQGSLEENDKLSRIEQLQKRVATFEIREPGLRVALQKPFNPKFLDLIETLGDQVEHAIQLDQK